jgi:hypothetical protein
MKDITEQKEILPGSMVELTDGKKYYFPLKKEEG